MNTTAMTNEVIVHLASYIEAFNSNSGAAIAKCYIVPCLLVRGDGSLHALSSRADVEAFFQAVADQTYAQGCRDWRYSNLEISPLGGQCVLATMDWEPLRSDGTAIRKWRQTYQLLRIPEGFRFAVSTIHAPLLQALGHSGNA